jgi:hypothetical protein
MANRSNHYEAALEAYLRQLRIPYLAIDEKRRSLLGERSVKNLDFVVAAPGGASWLVDVKGRRFPAGSGRQFWKNWSTYDDLESMGRWQALFGERSAGLFVFAYHLVARESPVPADQVFSFQSELYGFLGIRLADYAKHARRISPRWETLALPTLEFRRLARPLATWLTPPPAPAITETALVDDSFLSAWE